MKPNVQKILQKFSNQKVELALIDDAEQVSDVLLKYSQNIESETKTLRGNISRIVDDYYQLEERFEIAGRLQQQLIRSFKELGVEYKSSPIAKKLDKALEAYKTLSSKSKIGPLLKI